MTARYEADVNGRPRQVTVRREEGRFVVTVDRRTWMVDAARVDAHTLSLLVRLTPDTAGGTESVRMTPDTSGNTRTASVTDRAADIADGRTLSYEVSLVPDPVSGRMDVRIGAVIVPVSLNGRRGTSRKDVDRHAGAGPQRIVAPMSGKVVRVLVTTGQTVRARQPIVVIEAMKMENELRAGRDGLVTDLPVASGQSVDAGTLLAVIAE